MRKHKLVLAGVTLLAASLAMTACGSRAEQAPGGEAGAAKVAKIGVIAPLSGDLSALGAGIKNSVDLAIKQANEKQTIPGWTLEIDAQDDQANPDVGKNAATKLAGDDEVIGVVGALNSSVSQSLQPVLSGAKIVQMSPANTGPDPDQGRGSGQPEAPVPGLLPHLHDRRCPGPVCGEVPDTTRASRRSPPSMTRRPTARAWSSAFTEAFKSGGGEIVGAETINPEDKDFSAVISRAKSANPEAIYYGGEYPQAGPLSQQAKSAGLNVPLMGGDGIYDPAFIELAGKTSEGDLAT